MRKAGTQCAAAIVARAAAAAPARPAATALLPSVIQVGRLIRRAAAAHGFYDGDARKAGKEEAASGERLAYDQEQALSDLALTMPALTLEDVAVQLVIGCGHASDLCNTEGVSPNEVRDNCLRVARIFASVTPVVVRAAGLTLDDITDSGVFIEGLRARHFPPLDVPADVLAPAHADVELIALCEEAITLDRECGRRMAGLETIEAEEVIEGELQPLYQRVAELTVAIHRVRPTTPAGEQAIARVVVQLRADRLPDSEVGIDDLASALIGRLALAPTVTA